MIWDSNWKPPYHHVGISYGLNLRAERTGISVGGNIIDQWASNWQNNTNIGIIIIIIIIIYCSP